MYLSFLLPLSVIFTSTQVISTYVGTELCPGIDYGSPPVAADKPTRNGFTGDVLNVTRCYCVTEDLKQCGYYHQADYSNYHNGRTYQTRYSCADDCGDYWPHGHKHVNKAEPPKCWATGTRKKHKECDTDEEGNKFCHKFYFVPAHIGAPDNAKA